MRAWTITMGSALIWACSTAAASAAETVSGPATTSDPPLVADVALRGAEGTLVGQVVDTQGKVVVGVPVHLRYQNKVVCQTNSDPSGRFAFKNLRGGVYQVTAADSFVTCRAWTDGTAPRSAQPTALLVVGGNPVRGQKSSPGRLGRFLRNPVVIGAGVATAVAVPLALANSDSSSDVDAGVDGTANTDPTTPETPVTDPAS